MHRRRCPCRAPSRPPVLPLRQPRTQTLRRSHPLQRALRSSLHRLKPASSTRSRASSSAHPLRHLSLRRRQRPLAASPTVAVTDVAKAAVKVAKVVNRAKADAVAVTAVVVKPAAANAVRAVAASVAKVVAVNAATVVAVAAKHAVKVAAKPAHLARAKPVAKAIVSRVATANAVKAAVAASVARAIPHVQASLRLRAA